MYASKFKVTYSALEAQLLRLKNVNNQKSLFLNSFPKLHIKLDISVWGKVH